MIFLNLDGVWYIPERIFFIEKIESKFFSVWGLIIIERDDEEFVEESSWFLFSRTTVSQKYVIKTKMRIESKRVRLRILLKNRI